MPGAVKETPHATRIWKGTDRKKDPLLELKGSVEDMDVDMVREDKDTSSERI